MLRDAFLYSLSIIHDRFTRHWAEMSLIIPDLPNSLFLPI